MIWANTEFKNLKSCMPAGELTLTSDSAPILRDFACTPGSLSSPYVGVAFAISQSGLDGFCVDLSFLSSPETSGKSVICPNCDCNF